MTTRIATALVGLLLEHSWRRLPIKTRLSLRRCVAEILAPRITRNAKAKRPLIIAGLLSQASGLGAAARASLDTLDSCGLPVFGIDLTVALRHEPDLSQVKYADGRTLIGEGTLLLHVNAPLVPAALRHLGRKFIKKKHIIGHWFWELDRMPPEWRSAIPFVHEVFVNTRFLANAVLSLTKRTPIHIVTYPLRSVRNAGNRASRAANTFTVLFIFNVLSNFERKNPCGAIKAFRLAFGDDPNARLIIKYINGAKWPESIRRMQAAAGEAPNIELIGDVLDEDRMNELYDRADVLLSLHRAEGLGLVIAEAMLRGVPVVATNFSGSTDFLTTETGIPIGYYLIPVVDPQGNYIERDSFWADPRIDEAAAALQALRANSHLRERLGQAAAALAADFFDPVRYVNQLKGILKLGT